jgi:hypothetical protein
MRGRLRNFSDDFSILLAQEHQQVLMDVPEAGGRVLVQRGKLPPFKGRA